MHVNALYVCGWVCMIKYYYSCGVVVFFGGHSGPVDSFYGGSWVHRVGEVGALPF